MAKSKVLVKNLATIETLSCVNVIASDKTGTLTQNKMFVNNALAGLESIRIQTSSGSSSSPLKDNLATKQLVAAASLCNNAHFEEEEKSSSSSRLSPSKQRKMSSALINSETRKAIGDATDIALLRFATQQGGHFASLPQAYTESCEIPFNSRNKWMMTTVIAKEPAVHSDIFGAESVGTNLMLIKGRFTHLILIIIFRLGINL